jgi:hypothetical protein
MDGSSEATPVPESIPPDDTDAGDKADQEFEDVAV